MPALSSSDKVRVVRRMCSYIPHAVLLGIRLESIDGEKLTLPMPNRDELAGNPETGAVHSGVVGGFMEQAADFHLIAKMEQPVLPRIIDFSLDYLRPARLRDTYAQCTLTRQGRFIANISITAWQEQSATPNAMARAHFLLPETDNS